MEEISSSIKKGKPVAVEELSASSMFLDERPVYDEGYDQESKTVVRLVSPKASNKPYRVRGIDDVAARNNWKGWLYLAPVIILVAVFLIYPLVNTIFIAFTANYQYATGTFDGLTLRNFGYILGLVSKSADNPGAMEVYFVRYAIPNTFIIVIVTVPISTFLALIISVALNSIKWFQKTLQTLFFLPYVTNAIAVGMVFSVIFDDKGIINYIFGLNMNWIQNATQYVAMIPLCIYIVWSSIPFKILIFLSGLQGIDKQYYQAAQIDSCSKAKVLWKITVPLLSPQILYILITSFMGAFKEYTAVVGLFNGPGTSGKGDPNMETIVYYIYENLNSNTSAAAAAAVFLFVIILVFTALQFWASKKRVHY
ncbi:MAG: sugar ABC transporter permease [Bacilli bacterium]|nr:sugar ABC transporter permease [Bacilli bacterium]